MTEMKLTKYTILDKIVFHFHILKLQDDLVHIFVHIIFFEIL